MTDAATPSAAQGPSEKPAVLIVGGLGYIGRFLARHIHTNKLASEVRLVDKVLPQLAHLAPEFQDSCASPSTFVQADASRETSMSRIFDRPNTTHPYDFVFNLGGETAWSQAPEIYKLRSYQLSVALATEAARRNIGVFVEVSTGMVYAPNRTPRKESDKLKPWLKLARAKLDAEETLGRIAGLNLVILRLAHVYGEYDAGFIAKALCLARVYQDEGKELKWLWTEDLRINTVWVRDVVRAMWQAAVWRAENRTWTAPPSDQARSPSSSRRPSLMGGSSNVTSGPSPSTPVFNIVDRGSTSQGTLASIISIVFGIKTGFQGSLISSFAKMNLEHVVDDLNEDVLQPWAEMLARKGIDKRPGPLSPFLEKELLKDTDLSLDGTLFETVTGFEYERPGGLDVEGVREMVASYDRMGWWP